MIYIQSAEVVVPTRFTLAPKAIHESNLFFPVGTKFCFTIFFAILFRVNLLTHNRAVAVFTRSATNPAFFTLTPPKGQVARLITVFSGPFFDAVGVGLEVFGTIEALLRNGVRFHSVSISQ